MTARALIFLVLAPFLLLSCASSGGASNADGTPMRVALRDYRSGMVFELVGESHTDRVDYYSTPRNRASRKVVSDEVMEAVLEFIADNGFVEHSTGGPAPAAGSKGLNTSFELEAENGVAHWATNPGSSLDERKQMGECTRNFLGLYNQVTAYQTIDTRSGGAFFESSAPVGSER